MRKSTLFTRRSALYLGLGSLAGIGALMKHKATHDSQGMQVLANTQKRNFTVVGQTPLKERAARKGLIYGADCGTLDLQSAPKLATALVQECGMLVAGFLKWDRLRPTVNTFDFSKGDWFAEFARNHNLLLRGHTLVWHEALPPWFKEKVNRQNSEQVLTQHIKQVVGHYAGQMHSWDVVNEAIPFDPTHSKGLRKTPWLEFLGVDYIDIAFRTAAETDPKAMLVYNDFGLEYDTPRDEAKRNAVLNLLEKLKSQGTPIHALGIQSHLFANETRFNAQKLRSFLKNVASMDLKILITEMDVMDKKLPLEAVVRDGIVAAAYEDYLSVVLDESAVICVTTWGLSDRYTWLSEFYPRSDGAAVRPLPLDTNFKRKLAWNAIARAFDHAPKRN